MSDRGVRHQNRGFHWRAVAVREHSMQRDLDDVSEIQLNLIVTKGVEESIERLVQSGFQVSDNRNDFVNRLLVQRTAGSVYEQAYVFVKFDVRRQVHQHSLCDCNGSESQVCSKVESIEMLGLKLHRQR